MRAIFKDSIKKSPFKPKNKPDITSRLQLSISGNRISISFKDKIPTHRAGILSFIKPKFNQESENS
jgi:hypothetical protein